MPREPLAKSDAQLEAKACGLAGQELGLSKEELSAFVGKHPTTTSATSRHGSCCHGSKG